MAGSFIVTSQQNSCDDTASLYIYLFSCCDHLISVLFDDAVISDFGSADHSILGVLLFIDSVDGLFNM